MFSAHYFILSDAMNYCWHHHFTMENNLHFVCCAPLMAESVNCEIICYINSLRLQRKILRNALKERAAAIYKDYWRVFRNLQKDNQARRSGFSKVTLIHPPNRRTYWAYHYYLSKISVLKWRFFFLSASGKITRHKCLHFTWLVNLLNHLKTSNSVCSFSENV